LISARDAADAVLRRVDGARGAVATRTRTHDLDTESWLRLSEGSVRISEFGVPSEFEEGVSRRVLVGTCDIWRPVSKWLRSITPNASIVSIDTGSIYVVMSCGAAPVTWIRNCDTCPAIDLGWNKHRLTTRQDSLAK